MFIPVLYEFLIHISFEKYILVRLRIFSNFYFLHLPDGQKVADKNLEVLTINMFGMTMTARLEALQKQNVTQ